MQPTFTEDFECHEAGQLAYDRGKAEDLLPERLVSCELHIGASRATVHAFGENAPSQLLRDNQL